MKLLLLAGANPNLPTQVSYGWGALPLTCAAESGDLDHVRALIHAGAAVSEVSPDGRTALAAAASNGHVAVVSELLNLGADVNQPLPRGQTALYFAVFRPRGQRVPAAALEKLLASGARIDVRDEEGRTPLLHAATAYHPFSSPESVRVLWQAGADAQATDNAVRNAIQVAVEIGGDPSPELIAALREGGVDAGRRNRSGQTPREYILARLADVRARQETSWEAHLASLFPSASVRAQRERSLQVLALLQEHTR